MLSPRFFNWINQMLMKHMLTRLFIATACLCCGSAYAQPGEIVAVDDSLCVMAGDSIMYNVTSNDSIAQGLFSPVFLLSPSDCFELSPDGHLSFRPGAGNCCGEHILRYRYEICQPPSKCSAEIKIIVKCPKPDCFFVNLDDYGGNSADPSGQDPKDCIYACENNPALYYVNYDSSSTYTWAVTGGSVSPGSNPAEISVVWGPAGTGFITLTITNSNGESTVLNFCVTILDGPTAAFQASADSVCKNAPISFINNSTGGTGYFWDFGDGNTSNSFQPTHQYAGPGTYTVTLIVTKNNYDANGNPLCCCSDTAMQVVFVDSLAGPNIYCISTLCAGDSSKYWTDATNCSTYLWTVLDENGLPLPFTGQGNDTICVLWGNGPFGTISLQVSGCDSAYCDQPVSVLVPIISPTVAINGPTSVCENGVATYTVPKWMSVDYDWQVTGGTVLSGQGTNTVVIQWGTAPGPGTINLTYASEFLGGLPGHEPGDCAGMAALTVAIKPAFELFGPVPPVVCVNSVSSFFATPAPSASYTWTISPAASFSGQGTNIISVTWDAGPGTFTVTATPNDPTAYCNGPLSKVIQVVETPRPTGIDGPVEICPGIPYSYIAQSAQSGVGFQWTVQGGTPASFTGNPLTVVWNNSGPYSLGVAQFGLNAPNCQSDTIQVPVSAKQLNGPLSISGPAACTNTVQNYSAAPAQHPDAVYAWTINPATAGSVIGGQGTPNAQVQWNNTPGPVSLMLKIYLCNDSLSASLPVTLSAAAPPTITQSGILCPGVPATLDAGAGYTNYIWSTSDPTQMITITTGGTYLVTVTNSGGCTSVGTYQAVPLPGPTASISTPNPTTLCYLPPNNNTVTITALTGGGYTYAWYCNGTLQALPPSQSNFVHTNTQVAGTFNYWVVVTDANGCTKQSNTITVQQVDCTGQPLCIPQPYGFTFTATNPPPNCNTGMFNVSKTANVTVTGWNFNDPGNNINSGTLLNAVHTYTKAGCYQVVASGLVPSVLPPGGTCTVTAVRTLCIPLAADFSATVTCLSAAFTDLSTYMPGQGPVSWLWNFGDASTSTLQNPTHAYTSGGSYTVTLTATNAAGCQATITKTVVVAGLPTPTVSASPSPACVGQPVQFSASAPNIISWLWNFNDGATNGSQNPSHTYLTPGNYTCSLVVTDNAGCTNTVSLPLTVHPAPPPDTIAWSPALTVCAGNTVTLTAPAGSGYTYLWSTNATTPSITVSSSGTYSVLVTDANGCTLTPDSVTVTVLPLPVAAISGPKFICDAGCVTLTAPAGFGYTYQWLDQGNAPIIGATAQTLSVCDYNLLPAYSVVVTDANGCSATSAPFSVMLAVSPSFLVLAPPNPCEGTPVTLTVSPVQTNVVYSWNTGASGASINVIQAGTYTAVGTDTLSGCKHSASATVHPLPDLCLVPAGCYESCNPDTICGPDGLAAYQWNLNGLPIAGATGQCLIVTQSGTYSLTGTSAFGCTKTSDSLMLELIDCGCAGLAITAAASETDSCCWTLSYSGNVSSLYGLQIATADADLDINLGSLHDSLAVFSIGSNAVSLVHSQTGNALPAGALNNFLSFCFSNVVNSPQQVVVSWYDFALEIVCSDTLEFDCSVEPDCLYLQADSIYCDGKETVYTMTLCNPVDADFAVAYIVLQPKTPTGIVVTPTAIDETANPILPGECRTYTINLSGPGIENQVFCYSLTAHDEIPTGEVDTSLCCMLDTMYCIPIPDCEPCDDIGVHMVETLLADAGACCYGITLENNYATGYFDGIGLCLLSPGATMTMNNPFGSGWTTLSYAPTAIQLGVVPPLGSSLPLGLIQLPEICLQTSAPPPQLLEIKWMQGDSVVCRDTIELGCEPDCGFLLDKIVYCDPVTGNWVCTGLIKNTSPYTMGEAHIAFTSPAGLGAYNVTSPLGSLLPGGTQPFSFVLGAPARVGDTVCFTVALHALNDDAGHTQCCNFSDCLVLADCGIGLEPVFYPNPSNGLFFARLASKWPAGVRLQVVDMLGRPVAERVFPAAGGQEVLPVELPELKRGVYPVLVESGGKKWLVKLVVE